MREYYYYSKYERLHEAVGFVEAPSLLHAAQIMWREESLFPGACVSACIFDDDGTIGDPWSKIYGEGYKGTNLEIVGYFSESQLWQPIVVSNNPYRNKPIREVVGAENIFVPSVPSFYKQSDKSVHDVLGRLATLGSERTISSLYMVADRMCDYLFFNNLLKEYRQQISHVNGTFIKLPERDILRSRVGVLIP